jgi:predicted Fe-Mo cluster-binding NifX family protein
MSIKVAIPTDDGETISRHFGQAKYFKVFILDQNQLSSSELREKASHQHGDHSHQNGVHPGQQMVASISDCQVLISGGMGTPAFTRASEAGLKVFMTDNLSIPSALEAFLAKTLVNNLSLMHSH